MINSVRDAFAPALETLGYSINETDPSKLDKAYDILKKRIPTCLPTMLMKHAMRWL